MSKARDFLFATFKGSSGQEYPDVSLAIEQAMSAVQQYMHGVGVKVDDRIRTVGREAGKNNGKGIRVLVNLDIQVEAIQ